VAFLFLALDYYTRANTGDVLLVERNFFGVNRVRVEKKRFHSLVNGDTIHGLQVMYPEPTTEPMGYYCRSGPLGDVFEAFSGPMLKRRVGVIGLGSGGMAAYAQPEQNFTFYEIDPVVVALASDPRLFTYLTDCLGKHEIVLGDARLRLAEAPQEVYDMLVLDAFSSDSIPIHLLTKEALDLYLSKLKPDGVLVLHISNRYLELEPMLVRLAAKKELFYLSRTDNEVSNEEQKNGKRASQYMVMARRESDVGPLAENKKWEHPAPSEKSRVWTDDYSDILNVLNW
jgi:SAM-dependent methyltransferase